jgi:hypothetical protein
MWKMLLMPWLTTKVTETPYQKFPSLFSITIQSFKLCVNQMDFLCVSFPFSINYNQNWNWNEEKLKDVSIILSNPQEKLILSTGVKKQNGDIMRKEYIFQTWHETFLILRRNNQFIWVLKYRRHFMSRRTLEKVNIFWKKAEVIQVGSRPVSSCTHGPLMLHLESR